MPEVLLPLTQGEQAILDMLRQLTMPVSMAVYKKAEALLEREKMFGRYDDKQEAPDAT